MSIKVIWEVEDGYVGKSRPKYTLITEQDLEDFGVTDESSDLDIEDVVFDLVKESFREQISWSITSNMEEIIKLIKAKLEVEER